MSDTLRDLVIKLGFAVDSTPLDAVENKLDKTKAKATGFGKELENVAKRFTAFKVVEKGFDLAKGAIVDTSAAAIEFGQDIAQLQTILPGEPERVAELRTQIMALAAQTGTDAKAITSSVNDVLQAFGDSPAVMDIATTAVKGAAAGGTDAKTAFDLLSATMLAYGDTSAHGAKTTMDLAFSMRQFGKIEISEMAQRIGMVSGQAKFLGVTQKELFAIMGTAAGITGQTAQTYTQFSALMTELSSPKKGSALAKIYQQLGIHSIKATVAQQGLIPVLKKIVEKTDGTTEALSRVFTNQEALRLILPITTTLYGRYGEAMDTAGKSAGNMLTAFGEVQGGFNETGTAIKKIEEKTANMERNFGLRTAPMMLAWKTAWYDLAEGAIKASDKMTDAVTEADGGFMALLKHFGMVLNLGGLAVNAAAVETFGTDEQERLAKKAFQMALDDTSDRAFDGGAQAKATRAEERASRAHFDEPKKNAAFKNAVDQSIKTGDIIINVSADDIKNPRQLAKLVKDAIHNPPKRTAENLHRDVPNAASGDNP